jgi:hypothetical protein
VPTNPRDSKRRLGGLGPELEPSILPRQLRALEEIGARLEQERPTPSPDFRGRLRGRVEELDRGADEGRGTPRSALLAAACFASGSFLLLIAAAWVALG